jgi:hypothetical protein
MQRRVREGERDGEKRAHARQKCQKKASQKMKMDKKNERKQRREIGQRHWKSWYTQELKCKGCTTLHPNLKHATGTTTSAAQTET